MKLMFQKVRRCVEGDRIEGAVLGPAPVHVIAVQTVPLDGTHDIISKILNYGTKYTQSTYEDSLAKIQLKILLN